MKKLMYILAICGVFAFAEEAKPIFDGKSLDGWQVKGAAECWSVTDGAILGKNNDKKQGSTLWTNDAFGDFVLEAEFQFSGEIDSGFFLRNESEQIQLGVSRSLKRDMSCAPYIGKKGIYPVGAVGVNDLLKMGEWNQIKITVKGKKYIVVLNGKQVLDYTTDEVLEEGPIGLQVHQGVVMQIMFRNLKVKSL
jgi:Domain of Unknown Function (DUF1080)